jgi:hypothetical protein
MSWDSINELPVSNLATFSRKLNPRTITWESSWKRGQDRWVLQVESKAEFAYSRKVKWNWEAATEDCYFGDKVN